MRDIMVDIETLGTKNSSVFLSIAAVCFDRNTGETGKKFSVNVSLASALEEGLTVDAETIEWWMKQNPDTRRKMFSEPVEVERALNSFEAFIFQVIIDNDLHEETNPVCLWGNSASFDLGILTHAYQKLRRQLPWNFYFERDYRTLIGEWGDLVPKPEKIEAHEPTADCLFQIKRLCAVFDLIKGNYTSKYKDSEFEASYTEGLTLLHDTLEVLREYHQDTEASTTINRIETYLNGDSGVYNFTNLKINGEDKK